MMADPRPVLPEFSELTVTLHRNDDENLSCLFCHGTYLCEWAIVLRGFGQRTLIGLHERCREELERKRVRP